MNRDYAVSWVYVACHRNMPNEAYGIIVDDPKLSADVAQFVAESINEGAIVSRVTLDDGKKMMMKYFDSQTKQESLDL